MTQMLTKRHPQSHGVALNNLLESVWIYLTVHRNLDAARVRAILIQDYTGTIRRDVPRFLKHENSQEQLKATRSQNNTSEAATPPRQRRHLSTQ